MMPDYNHDGEIDRYDREMETIFQEEEEQYWKEQETHGGKDMDGWAVLIVAGIMAIGYFLIKHF